LQQLERQLSGLARRQFGSDRGRAASTEGIIVPAVDVFQRGHDLVVRAELPGVDPDRDIDVTVQDGVLVIRGERKAEERIEEKDYVRMESFSGSFSRSVPLPTGVKEDDIRANYENGILEIVVPGAAKGKEPKRISVSSQSQRPKAVTSGRRKSA
jgi:HSP20 family protein